MSRFLQAWQVGKPIDVHTFPRPPLLERVPFRLQILCSGADPANPRPQDTIADTRNAWWVLETHHPPTYYIPPRDIKSRISPTPGNRGTHCEWKGAATYWDVFAGDQDAAIRGKAWSYEQPTASFIPIAGHLSFYATEGTNTWDCYVDGEKVHPQPGDFYGGWMSSRIDGGKQGVKGPAGTWGW
ncbi:hypothetical protein PYCC9005_000724 [Savitreella phatthalungensis]